MHAWNQLETSKKELEAATQHYEQQSTIIHVQIAAHNKQITDLIAQINTLKQDREAKEKNVPAEWLPRNMR